MRAGTYASNGALRDLVLREHRHERLRSRAGRRRRECSDEKRSQKYELHAADASAVACELVRRGFPAVVGAAVVAGKLLELEARVANALVAELRDRRAGDEPGSLDLLDLGVPPARVHPTRGGEGTELVR